MEFRILAATGADGRLWSGLVERLPPGSRDLHYLPQYGLIYQSAYGHEPLLAYLAEGREFAMQPFVVRCLNALPFLAEQGVTEPFHDIANAYGYGGPLCSDPAASRAADLLAGLDERLRAWCSERRIASEFCSLHPVIDNRPLVAGWRDVAPRPQKRVVYLDLTRGEAALWRDLNRGHRSSINRARNGGVRIERVAPDAAALAEFGRLYTLTMERHRAAGRWHLPPGYFDHCVRLLGPGCVELFFARSDGAVAAAYFLLRYSGIAYYQFGGSDDAYFALRPNNLLLYETALWAQRAGDRVYYLGGGVTDGEDDSLLRYKTGFGGVSATLYTYGRIHHRATYDRLCELKARHEQATLGRVLDTDYFPLYRRERPVVLR